MKSSPPSDAPASDVAPGRPPEIELPTNRLLIHPLSRALVDRLIPTPVTPNQVSVAGVVASGVAAGCYVGLPGPWNAFAGFAFQVAWHVLDGADGDLARRTGRASASGELIDGICDHLGQALIYIPFAMVLARTMGPWAWGVGAAAAGSHFVQANLYETGRKTYRRWVYGAPWMRQTLSGAGSAERFLGAGYLALSRLGSPGEQRVETAMHVAFAAGEPGASDARRSYRALQEPVVKGSGLLASNSRTMATFLSLLAGSPLWFFLYEVIALNGIAGISLLCRGRRNRALIARLESRSQAASAANCNLASRA